MVYLFPWKHNAGGNIMNSTYKSICYVYEKAGDTLQTYER